MPEKSREAAVLIYSFLAGLAMPVHSVFCVCASHPPLHPLLRSRTDLSHYTELEQNGFLCRNTLPLTWMLLLIMSRVSDGEGILDENWLSPASQFHHSKNQCDV